MALIGIAQYISIPWDNISEIYALKLLSFLLQTKYFVKTFFIFGKQEITRLNESELKIKYFSYDSPYILRKTIEGYLNSFDNIIFDKIFFKQSIFVSDRTTNMQSSKMQNKIYGPVPHQMYQPSLAKVHKQEIKRFYFSLQPLPGHCLCSNFDHRQLFTPIF